MLIKYPVGKMRKVLRDGNRKHNEQFVCIPESQWPKSSEKRIKVMRNRDFFVQVFESATRYHRITVNRTAIDNDGKWIDGITWDELQHIKNCVGYSGDDAVELYPAQGDVVNVANMRHLWVNPGKPFQFKWTENNPENL